ncbi:MAG TPA: hypothetical protein VG013_26060 [Gemmataceae bacterium]|jgi:hypothetical protein|nr:hypothetical protein [Gemmataceae bacterium]
MFRKLLLASVVSVGVLSPFAVAAKADAHEFRHEERHERACRVYYRDPCRPAWVFAGTVRDHREAERFAEHYRGRGFAISIR